jgi:signal transduction histidine kinase
VHNEGDAIPIGEQAAIFEPFYRSSSAISGSHNGWGVGLTLVRGIAEAHGGTVRVQSEADGTTFVVSLPVPARSSPVTPSRRATDRARPGADGG